ncbi:MAG: GNAT family N-acetyltransferase [Acidimicrobiia bacterium]|nr:GNAT family N-acetyltransferase [Acidimicrobiia bacterium]
MTVERLNAAHGIDTFSCGNEELDLWLRHAALTADRAGTARVYVVLGGTKVLGYFALLPHQVRRADIPPGIGRGAPDTIPSYLLARLAVAEDLHGTGLGGELLALALVKILDAITIAGGRLIVVDAIDEPATDFYRHHGFRPTQADPGRLVMKASTAAASLGVDWP